MASFNDISSAIAIGQGYYTQILNNNTTALKGGFPTKFQQRLVCLKRLMTALQWDVEGRVNDDTTTALYELLLNETASYDGSGVVVNPNVIIPGHTIVVDGTSNFVESAPVFFNAQSILIDNWSANYYSTYGNRPDIDVFDLDGTPQESTAPKRNYPSDDPTQPLQSISWNYAIITQGYYIIKGLKPQSL
jgi:hypothetical protein